MKHKIAIGLSGGVDSSVAAWLLKQQGHDLLGLFMINWRETTGTLSGDCPHEDDFVFAQLVARKLDIPLEVVDLSHWYSQRVVDYMFHEYGCGRTPNPDVLCNREIKFDLFAKAALERGATAVATGHYCRKETITVDGVETYRLLAGLDPEKDQSYFLCQLSQQQLSTALFPIGNMLKSQVRKIAQENDLATAKRKDSQGICFVGKVDLPVFLQQKLKAKKGIIVEIPADFDYEGHNTQDYKQQSTCYKPQDGVVVGTHIGAHFFTIGQRKGLGVGGKEKPLFVIATDVENNIVYVGQGNEHPGLYRNSLFIDASNTHWIRPDLEMKKGCKQRLSVRVRYRQPLQNATLYQQPEGILIIFDKPQRGISPGQFAAWYDNDELTGSGVIS